MSWWDAFTVLDVETSGLDPDKGARVLELGIARFERGQCVEQCNYVVWAPVELDPKLEGINGLTQAALEAARDWPFHRVWEVVADLFTGAVPVAYNACFDRRFIQTEVRQHTGVWAAQVLRAAHVHHPQTAWIDPLIWVRHFDKYERSKKLVDACRRRGITIERAHQAVWDAVATGALLLQLAPKLRADTDILTATQLQYAAAQERDRAAHYAKKNGQSVTEGSVFVCDACHTRTFTEKKDQLPAGWGLHPHAASGTKHVCSAGCKAQWFWWDGVAVQTEG